MNDRTPPISVPHTPRKARATVLLHRGVVRTLAVLVLLAPSLPAWAQVLDAVPVVSGEVLTEDAAHATGLARHNLDFGASVFSFSTWLPPESKVATALLDSVVGTLVCVPAESVHQRMTMALAHLPKMMRAKI